MQASAQGLQGFPVHGRIISPRWRCILPHVRCSGRDLVCRRSCRRSSRMRTLVSIQSEFSGFSESTNLARQKSLEEYLELKKQILSRTRNASGFIALYLTLAVSPLSGLSSVIGSCTGYIYLLLLMRGVDRLSPGDEVPMKEVEKLPEGIPRYFGKWVTSYKYALKPRLLVLVGVAAGLGLYNALSAEELPLSAQGSLLLGFLSYKVPFFQMLIDDLRPEFKIEDLDGPGGPPSVGVGDEIERDIYGRRKKTVEEKIEDVSGDK